ncbi:bifunctional folylpolyglutamate synthase/dihydrofolate synthase [Miniphocaeibacter massiliensis]|uniref:bifunctional folylpolyglutamate synthase/dihydrofolate synthase n=1 Tax=Miniphocaeibacter massiliensis TaxID=2041841 RepID=UPI000C1C2A6F|nr:folylpolyglutamate synthase/dihydrofolate synthase family protein [Miniphocaeibacter massiliensis]
MSEIVNVNKNSIIKKLKDNNIIELNHGENIFEIYNDIKNLDISTMNKAQTNIYFEILEEISEFLFVEESNNWNRQGMDLGLDRMKLLLSYIDSPEKSLKVIHVGGTNGKGSVSNYIKSILLEAGHKVGVYSSPNIDGYNDGIKINDKYISFIKLYDLLLYVKSNWEIKSQNDDYITFFEAMTAAMLLYFKEEKVDYAIIEVGLGGRSDATNIFRDKLLSIITSISMDHIGVLGNTIEEIAYEKAGIIQENENVIVYPSDYRATDVIKDVCIEKNSKFNILDFKNIKIVKQNSNGNIFNFRKYEMLEIKMLGKHQIYNASLALLAIESLVDRKLADVSEENIRNGLKKSKLPGRLEIISSTPKIILDGAHNDDAIDYLINFFENSNFNKLRVVMGVLKDKSHKNIFEKISSLPAKFYLTEVPFESRKMTVYDMKEELREFTFNLEVYPKPREALDKAILDYEEDDIILVTGSLYLISQLRKYIVEKY